MEPLSPLPSVMLLDLDDTIIDYGGDVETTWRTLCVEAAEATPGLDDVALFAAIQRTRTWYWSDPERHREGRADLRAASRRIIEQALQTLGVDQPQLAEAMAHRYRDRREARMRPFPGAVETLQRLRSTGTRLGMVTNGTSADQRAKIERFALAPYFDHILIEGELGFGKPDERVYRTALQALNARAEDTWFVGDNLEWDVAAPQRVGLYGVWVDTPGKGLPDAHAVRPDRIISALVQII